MALGKEGKIRNMSRGRKRCHRVTRGKRKEQPEVASRVTSGELAAGVGQDEGRWQKNHTLGVALG